MPKVIVLFQGQEWLVELKEGVNVIGRSNTAAVPVRDPSMSREHSEIHVSGSVCTVHDKGSMNGTVLNGTKTKEKVLSPGDKIQIGNTVIFYEEKKGDERPLPPAKDSTAPESDSKIMDAKTPPVGTLNPPTKRSEVKRGIAVRDYSAWGKDSGGSKAGIILAVVALLVIGGGFVAFKMYSAGPTGAVDKDNLAYNPSFEMSTDKNVAGWALRPGSASRVASTTPAKDGAASLLLDKAGGAGDLIAEVSTQESYELGKSGRVDFSAWARVEAFSGLVALKMTWYSKLGGTPILEEFSEPAARSGDWVKVSREFTPPPGAGAFQPGLCGIGRSGRIYFDDVKLYKRDTASAPRELELAPFTFGVGSSGGFSVVQGAKRVIGNGQLNLVTEKDGSISQALAGDPSVTIDAAAKKISSKGKLYSPIDLRGIDFEQEIKAGANYAILEYSVKGELLKQLDRISLSVLVPRGELIGSYSKEVSRVAFRSEAGDYSLELAEGLMMVTADSFLGSKRFTMSMPIERGATEFRVAFALRVGTAGTGDLVQLAKQAETANRLIEALGMYRQLELTTREVDKLESVRNEIRRLEDLELRHWNGYLAAKFRAGLMKQKSYFEQALFLLEKYAREWAGGKFAGQVKAEQAALQAGIQTSSGDRDSERARRLLQLARECSDSGRRALASEYCRVIREQYSTTEYAVQAAELLKTLSQ